MSQVGATRQTGTNLLQDVQAAVERDAAADGIGKRWAWTGFWFPAVGLLALGLVFVVHRSWFYLLQQEDQPVEWTQFGLCLFSSLVLGPAAVRLWLRGHRGQAAVLALTALGSLVLAGEEISWGQRVIGLSTPEELAEINHQAEMNVHNINVGVPSEALFKLFAFGMGAAGAAAAWFTRRPLGALHRTRWWLIAPPLLAVPGFLGMALYRMTILVLPLHPVVRAQEWVEVGLYGSLAVTAACCYVRAAPGRYHLDLTDAAEPVRRPDPKASVKSGA